MGACAPQIHPPHRIPPAVGSLPSVLPLNTGLGRQRVGTGSKWMACNMESVQNNNNNNSIYNKKQLTV